MVRLIGLLLPVVLLTACGSDDPGDTVADPAAETASTSATPSESPSASPSCSTGTTSSAKRIVASVSTSPSGFARIAARLSLFRITKRATATFRCSPIACASSA